MYSKYPFAVVTGISVGKNSSLLLLLLMLTMLSLESKRNLLIVIAKSYSKSIHSTAKIRLSGDSEILLFIWVSVTILVKYARVPLKTNAFFAPPLIKLF